MVAEAEWLNALQQADVLVVVLPVYLDEGRDDRVQRRLAEVSADLVVADLTAVERRLERLERDLSRAPRAERQQMESEQSLQESLKVTLDEGVHLRALEWDETRLNAVRSFGFMTLKPMGVILNSSEDDVDDWEAGCEEVSRLWPYPGDSGGGGQRGNRGRSHGAARGGTGGNPGWAGHRYAGE